MPLLSTSRLVSLRLIRTHRFSPAHITGTLHSEEFRFIALALNGTVRAITQPWSFAVKGKYGRWSALLDPQLFRSGKNTLEAFGVITQNDQATLIRAAGSPQHLPVFRARVEEQQDSQKEAISTSPYQETRLLHHPVEIEKAETSVQVEN